MDWDSMQRILMGVLSVATIISTAVVGVLFGTNKTLRDTVADRGVRIDDLEKENVRKDADLAEKVSENRVLKSMVTNKVEIVALTDLMDEHHRSATVTWASIDGHIQALPDQIAAVIRRKDER